MTPLQPLAVLLEQSEGERDRALADHQRARAACDAAQVQAQQLVDYRREHERRWSAQFAHAGRAELLQCYHSFGERLTQAIEQQQRAAEQAAQRLDSAALALREAELRCASVRKLIERRTAELSSIAARREQQQTDETAARAWSRLGAAARGGIA